MANQPNVFQPVTVPDLYERAAYGLLDNITWVTPPDGHWQAGIQWDTECTRTDVTISPCISGAPDVIASKAATWDGDTRGAIPFTVFGEADCSPAGSDWWDRGQAAALRALSNSGPISVENTFWTGRSANAPVVVLPNLTTVGPIRTEFNQTLLLQPAATIITGTLDVVEGLQRLEGAFVGCYDGEAWVHIPLGVVEAFCARDLIQEKNGRLYTWGGNRVIVGRGYPTNVGPGGVTPTAGTTFIFMTSPVFGIRGAPRSFSPTESLNRNINTVKFIAEQNYVLGWHCCIMGAQVTLGGEPAGVFNDDGPAT